MTCIFLPRSVLRFAFSWGGVGVSSPYIVVAVCACMTEGREGDARDISTYACSID